MATFAPTLPRITLKTIPPVSSPPLLAALQELDLLPLQPGAVAMYKRSKEQNTITWHHPTPSIADPIAEPYAIITKSRWERVAYADRAAMVPEFISRKAAAIKERVPDVELSVEELYVNKTRHPDPFLIARLDGECYHVEVWDERDFERDFKDR